MVKNLPADAGDAGDVRLIPGSRRTPRGGNGNPLQYSCLENPTDRGAWRATVHGVEKESDTTKHTHRVIIYYPRRREGAGGTVTAQLVP